MHTIQTMHYIHRDRLCSWASVREVHCQFVVATMIEVHYWSDEVSLPYHVMIDDESLTISLFHYYLTIDSYFAVVVPPNLTPIDAYCPIDLNQSIKYRDIERSARENMNKTNQQEAKAEVVLT
jgi:hypothetical protein